MHLVINLVEANEGSKTSKLTFAEFGMSLDVDSHSNGKCCHKPTRPARHINFYNRETGYRAK